MVKYLLAVVLCLLPAGLFAQDAEMIQGVRIWTIRGYNLEIIETLPADYVFEKPEAAKHVFCDFKNFDLFFQFFAEDARFQKSFTSFPLKYTVIEPNAAMETTDRTIYVVPAKQDDIGFLFPNRQQRLENDLKCSVENYGFETTVTLRQSDSGVRIDYVFKYGITNGGCWYLEAVIDSST